MTEAHRDEAPRLKALDFELVKTALESAYKASLCRNRSLLRFKERTKGVLRRIWVVPRFAIVPIYGMIAIFFAFN